MQALTVSLWYLFTMLFTIEYYQRVNVPRPPFGHFNWRDLLFALGMVVAMPFFYLALPTLGVTIVFGLFWLMLLYSILSPLVRWSALAGLAVVVAQWFLRTPWLINLNMLVVGMGVGPTFIKNGLRSGEVCAFAVILMIYDVVATLFAKQMMPLVIKLVQQPYFLGFLAGGRLLGAGDVVLSGLFVADMTRSGGRRWGYTMAVAVVVPLLLTTLSGGFWRETGIPYLLFASPVYLVLRWVLARAQRRGRQTAAAGNR
ncbi:MAG: hypothetical protein K6T75_07340 [Acetobacteraceae bacterium]|nr:hypothetical protein [Acetobacteraceae bacterium]